MIPVVGYKRYISTEPETKEVNGDRLISFVVTDKHKPDDSPTWIKVECWGAVAEQASLFTKGDFVSVSGLLFNRRWVDREGVERSNWTLRAESVRVSSRGKEPYPQATSPSADTESEIPF